jgi:hypothetical protein
MREMIFIQYIAYPLDKMAENIINTFKFPYVHHSFDDIKKQVVSFLVTNLHKYSSEKGKAFSYFSIIAKNYLIYHNNNGYKEEKRSFSIHEDAEEVGSDMLISSLESVNEHEHDDVKEFVKLMVDYWEGNVHRHFKKRRDIDIANAVVELFRRVDTIENFNKKALYLMIREITDCKTGYITKVVNKMRSVVNPHMLEYYNEGTVNDQENNKFFRVQRKRPKS